MLLKTQHQRPLYYRSLTYAPQHPPSLSNKAELLSRERGPTLNDICSSRPHLRHLGNHAWNSASDSHKV